MAGAFSALALLAAAHASVAPLPETHRAVVFYNARMALAEGRSGDVLKLWLLRNALKHQGEPPQLDEEFRSVVWAALGNLGVCPDGFPRDDLGGAGLWTLGLHNWAIQEIVKGEADSAQTPFETFEVGRQQRLVSLHDVLSDEEWRSVTFFRTGCFAANLSQLGWGEAPFVDWRDRYAAGVFLRRLLVSSLASVDRTKVESLAAVEARIFDLDLVLTQLAARNARRESLARSREARLAGVSEVGAQELARTVAAWAPGSPQAAFLRRTLRWSARDWLSLSPARRLFLFAQAKTVAKAPADLEPLLLSIIDGLIEQGAGQELEPWIAFLEAKDVPARRNVLIQGDRGKRLLELDAETGFRERAVVALHRGVAFLEAGDRQHALRSLAYAMKHAESSRDGATTVALSRRWLSYVLSRYETDGEVVATLKALVPRQEYNLIVEDLIWRAALRADRASYELLGSTVHRGSALDGRIAQLRPLAVGKAGELITALREGVQEQPYFTLRFVKQLIEQLESEEAEVRRRNLSVLRSVRQQVLEPLVAQGQGRGAHARNAEALLARVQAILEGLAEMETSVEGLARAQSPAHEVFAGSIRLPPADPLPWPFRTPEPEAPSAFIPLVLKPVEWKDSTGNWVFGWRVTE